MEKEELKKIIEKHESWLAGDGGEKADLHGESLRDEDLHGVDLRGANFCKADLRGTDLHGANLCRADLRGADLCGADLRRADLRGANLDFSCWPLWCGSLQTKADSKIVIQLLYHAMRLAENSDIDEELKNALFTKELIAQANRFHRVEECGKIKDEE